MSNTDNFDTDIEQADAEFEEQQAAPAAVKKKKSGNGFLFFILFLLAAGGGGFYALKTSMIKLPFAIPGVTPVAQQAPAADPALASADPAASAPAVDPNLAPAADPALASATGELPVPESAGLMPPEIGDEVAGAGIIAPSNPEMIEDPFAPAGSAAMPTDPSAAAAPANDPAMVAGDMPADPFAAAPTMDTPAQGTNDMSAQGAAVANTADPFAAPVEAEPAVTTPETTAPVAAVSDPFASSPTTATPVAAPASTEPAVTAADAQAYEARIATLEEKIELLEAALTNLQESQVTKADIEGLKNSITVAATDKAPVKTKAPKNDEALGAAQNEVENYRHGIMPGVVKAKRPASDEAYSPSKAAAAAAATSASVPSTAGLTTNTAWVLKSAKPGTAMVAERGSNEMKTVTVGDTLRGIGKVTSVVKDSNGKWVVSGTKGKISQ